MRVVAALAALILCGCGGDTVTPETYGTRLIKLPGGQTIRAEVMTHPDDMQRGMKYRDSLAPGRGMLFLHGQEGYHRYWMFEVRIPLDLIWLDRNRSIVQIIHQAPPCPGPQEQCKSYGGGFKAIYVLELAAGMAKQYGLRPGQTLDF
jgi:uncharacterized membrane protein (UPF0127 family)